MPPEFTRSCFNGLNDVPEPNTLENSYRMSFISNNDNTHAVTSPVVVIWLAGFAQCSQRGGLMNGWLPVRSSTEDRFISYKNAFFDKCVEYSEYHTGRATSRGI